MPLSSPQPSRFRPGKLLGLLLMLGFGLGLAWLAASQWQSASSREALEKLRAQSSRLYHFDALLLHVLDAESGTRGYMLTQNPVYLTPYQDGRTEIERTLKLLREGNWADADEQRMLELLGTLIEDRWSLLKLDIEHGPNGNTESPAGGTDKQLTDEIRRILGELRVRTLHDIDHTLDASFARFADVRATNRLLGAGILALLLALAIVLYRQDKLRRRLAGILHSENERLKTEVDARTTELTSLATYLTRTREAEQARLARELHDELGALMTAAKLDAGWIGRKLPAEVMAPLRTRFDRLIDTLNQVISIKRRVVDDLRPPLLSDLGLVEALRSLAQSGGVGEHDGPVELALPDDLPNLPEDFSLALFRIAQEALTNVRRHAQATRTRLALHRADKLIVLQIEDNGIGFDPETSRHRRHGLSGMAHRVQMLGGQLEVLGVPGKGTVITARVPLPEAD
ncbi:MAG: CHASE3 domain-containing protein [Azoarcus sp.]|nr:CHASE3 domain-containing protein [Azoarcus sp.]